MSDFHCLLLNKMQNQEQGKTIFFLLYPYFGKEQTLQNSQFPFCVAPVTVHKRKMKNILQRKLSLHRKLLHGAKTCTLCFILRVKGIALSYK